MDADLVAWCDGELADDALAAIEQRLRADPALRRAAAALLRQHLLLAEVTSQAPVMASPIRRLPWRSALVTAAAALVTGVLLYDARTPGPTVRLAVVADTWIEAKHPTVSHGRERDLIIAGASSPAGECWALLRFTMPRAGAARLRLRASAGGGARVVLGSGAWDESDARWHHRPGLASTPLATIPARVTAGDVIIDVSLPAGVCTLVLIGTDPQPFTVGSREDGAGAELELLPVVHAR